MAARAELTTTRRPRPLLLLIALGLLLVAWGIWYAGRQRASRIDLSLFGPCEDVCDALTRDGYIASIQLPYYRAAFLLDVAALVTLLAAGILGQFRTVGILVVLMWGPTITWHALSLFVCSVFSP
jgi:hypothetical protein